jgi:hypothetical protein
LAIPKLAMGVAQPPSWPKWWWPTTPISKNGGGRTPPLAKILSFNIFNFSLIFKIILNFIIF